MKTAGSKNKARTYHVVLNDVVQRAEFLGKRISLIVPSEVLLKECFVTALQANKLEEIDVNVAAI